MFQVTTVLPEPHEPISKIPTQAPPQPKKSKDAPKDAPKEEVKAP
jgi:hypothetical protein